MAKADQYSVWLAHEFLKHHVVRWFAEDVFEYDRRMGLYQVRDRKWLPHRVQAFLVDKLGVESVTTSGVKSVCEAIKNEQYLASGLHPPFWIGSQQEANVIVTRNVALLLDAVHRDGKPRVLPHSPDLFAICGVPYCYKPKADCPNWKRFVRWMVGGNEDEARLLQEFCAWVFVARRLKLEKILWLVGCGANGKSTFLRIVRYVIGEKATSAVGIEAFSGGENFKLQPTLHKFANFCNDASVRRKGNVAALNNFVSGDPFTINRKFREQLTVEPSTVCFFASNPMPLFDDTSDAFWRRLLLVRCQQRLSEAEIDPMLLHKLRAEASGVLNWVLAGIPTLLARGRFDVPESVRQNVADLKAQVNAARQFIREKVEAGTESDFITRDQFMGNFNVWCDENGFKREELNVVKDEMLATFDSQLRRLRKGPGGRRVPCWSGVRWMQEERANCDREYRNRELDSLRSTVEDQRRQIERLQRMLDELRQQADQKQQEDRPQQREDDDGEEMIALVKELSSEDEPANGLPATAAAGEAGT